ncbi:small GTP-binding protein, putative [Trichomonas vaginalis G3]|uniref:Small GTP-binding protein, putative n=1 Tax=Trichomonas vaginalis (strain ATCC PRA-98 / G3) TaxID=412133 RepID=A2EWA5_TRIV3|nr:GTPase protein [Trichomonas vaginalis G3]EAY03082.1 small GTP-binding protein, putative [Trichomonas vaginalis G3]KAI5484805.1 GTPase protein [Trichomonas vaginalis G3]|eukprot:XP_001315305.1 small GTP-binding protein [Trichomonas vaginalis G3]
MNTNKKFKVVLMGASSAGKTSIVVRFSRGTFGGDQESTIGAAFISRDVETEKGPVTLHIWDTAGQERYRSLVPRYSQGSKAIVIVFDVTDPESFEGAQQWFQEAQDMHANKVKYYLIANKIDLPAKVDLEKVQEYARQTGMCYYATSAKTGENITNLFDTIAGDVAAMIPADQDPDEVLLEARKKDEGKSGKCC